jgi:hypothetical protein
MLKYLGFLATISELYSNLEDSQDKDIIKGLQNYVKYFFKLTISLLIYIGINIFIYIYIYMFLYRILIS